VSFELAGFKGAKVSGQVVTAGKINAYNDFGKKEEVSLSDFKDVKISNGRIEAALPSKSVVLIQVRN
jgi:alpha-N-arabinofuranosidase